MSIDIELTGANVWPTGPNPLGRDLGQMTKRLFFEAIQSWHGGGSLADHLDRHARQVIREVMTDAAVLRWERRAVELERVGNESSDEAADACRAKAAFIRRYGLDGLADDIETAVAELWPAPVEQRAAA